MTKSGLVLEIANKTASIMTPDGEFIKVKIKNTIPQRGQTYSGEVYLHRPFYRNNIIAAILSFFILLSGGMYTYYTPAAELTVNINPSVKLILNRWNTIIKYSPVNEDGQKILSSIKLTNKSLDEGLMLIVDQSKTDNFINDEYITSGRIISININEDKKGTVNFQKLEETFKNQNLNVQIVNNNEFQSSDNESGIINSSEKDNGESKENKISDKADKDKVLPNKTIKNSDKAEENSNSNELRNNEDTIKQTNKSEKKKENNSEENNLKKDKSDDKDITKEETPKNPNNNSSSPSNNTNSNNNNSNKNNNSNSNNNKSINNSKGNEKK